MAAASLKPATPGPAMADAPRRSARLIVLFWCRDRARGLVVHALRSARGRAPAAARPARPTGSAPTRSAAMCCRAPCMAPSIRCQSPLVVILGRGHRLPARRDRRLPGRPRRRRRHAAGRHHAIVPADLARHGRHGLARAGPGQCRHRHGHRLVARLCPAHARPRCST